jgi:hypothetical protein
MEAIDGTDFDTVHQLAPDAAFYNDKRHSILPDGPENPSGTARGTLVILVRKSNIFTV